MDDFVTRAVHEEFAKRIDEENDRQNHRISILETGQAQISDLVASVKVLAVNMETMSKELSKQGERLAEIEGKPAKRWETVVACIITGILGFVLNMMLSGVFK
jgi:hypothetical protein